ncbi:PREDICTED: ADAMTS-like protein 2 [Branchiostoma belcheri]|uniref:ADAMTS-like protein 2 n=1 Tax=Branchiostoma belcheri TaxID=7741 RepID=A0A6P4YM63_BRABE|nr:PREDICTED: ADAMTS-like protein 2 [Branchiostoma belcheri]
MVQPRCPVRLDLRHSLQLHLICTGDALSQVEPVSTPVYHIHNKPAYRKRGTIHYSPFPTQLQQTTTVYRSTPGLVTTGLLSNNMRLSPFGAPNSPGLVFVVLSFVVQTRLKVRGLEATSAAAGTGAHAEDERTDYTAGAEELKVVEDNIYSEWSIWTACSRTCGTGVSFQQRKCLTVKRLIPVDEGHVSSVCNGGRRRYRTCNRQPIGCDGVLYSRKAYDRCGVCDGEGDTCEVIRGTFQETISASGYTSIVQLPVGSRKINIIHQRTNATYLALRNDSDDFYLNGDFVIHPSPKSLVAAGTVLQYTRQEGEGAVETITSDGPTTESLHVLLLSATANASSVTSFEYTVPKKPVFRQITVLGPSGEVRPPVRVLSEEEEFLGGPSRGLPIYFKPRSETETPRRVIQRARASAEEDDEVQASEDSRSAVPATVSAPLTRQPAATASRQESTSIPSQSITTPDPKKYHWKLNGRVTPCSTTCTPELGVVTKFSICVDNDMREVPEAFCDARMKPTPSFDYCVGKPCKARWITSDWTDCTKTCGSGTQKRTVRCWKVISRGLDTTVYDELCNSTAKPSATKECNSEPCPPEWWISTFSEDVDTTDGNHTNATLPDTESESGSGLALNPESEPEPDYEPTYLPETEPEAETEEELDVTDLDACRRATCGWQWEMSPWSPCSAQCGPGTMTREARCYTETDPCDPVRKPLTERVCDNGPCLETSWRETSWGQCSTTCGPGQQRRKVICGGVINRHFREFRGEICNLDYKPVETQICNEMDCPATWFASPWGPCSTTCGAGVRGREVVCYHGDQTSTSCDPDTMPVIKMSCMNTPCPRSEDEVNDNCTDNSAANCELVLRVNLCGHWYYKRACCHSCSRVPTTTSPPDTVMAASANSRTQRRRKTRMRSRLSFHGDDFRRP